MGNCCRSRPPSLTRDFITEDILRTTRDVGTYVREALIAQIGEDTDELAMALRRYYTARLENLQPQDYAGLSCLIREVSDWDLVETPNLARHYRQFRRMLENTRDPLVSML